MDATNRKDASAKSQAAAAVTAVAALAEAIHQLGTIPSGHLYAQVMSYLTIEAYNRIIEILKGADLVAEENHVLRWVGPEIK
jgi:hypothetical protein